jgi:hypothetical protein
MALICSNVAHTNNNTPSKLVVVILFKIVLPILHRMPNSFEKVLLHQLV